jgi:hypothetical protein
MNPDKRCRERCGRTCISSEESGRLHESVAFECISREESGRLYESAAFKRLWMEPLTRK